jgi:hypothetical protein
MASRAKPEVRAPAPQKGPTLVPPTDLDIQSIGSGLARVEAPEGWVKKVDRAREGKVWVGYFHVWEATPDGESARRKKEKTLGGPATKPKHEALNDLAEYIEHTGQARETRRIDLHVLSFGMLFAL